MTRSHLRVLTWHRVREPFGSEPANPSLVSATPAVFERQVQHLARRFRVVSLPDVLSAQRGESRLPRRSVLLTFDDAYDDFGEIAWPTLRRYGLPATLFVPTAFPGDRDRVFWWDQLQHAFERTRRAAVSLPLLGRLPLMGDENRRRAQSRVQQYVKTLPHAEGMCLVDRLRRELEVEEFRGSSVLSWLELRRLASEGVSLAAHTRNHPSLPALSEHEAATEIRESMEDLRRELGDTLPVFCYPYGLFGPHVVEQTRRQGVELAFTCLDGHNRLPTMDPLRLRRTDITRRTTPQIFRVRLWTATTYVDMWRHRSRSAGPEANGPAPRRPAPGRSAELALPRRPVPAHTQRSTDAAATDRRTVAYIMSRFPKLSETFVLNEILALESLGMKVEVYPLLRERELVLQPEAVEITARAHFHPFLSPAIVRAQLHFLRRRPIAYVRVLAEVLRGTWGSRNFFLGALGIFPKSVRFAWEMQRQGVAHVHAHFCSHPAVAALIVHRLTGIPFSFTAHGSDLHVERRMLDTKLEAADFAVAICEFNREVMVRSCGEHLRPKIHVIHCGVHSDYLEMLSIRSGGGLRIICVASLEEVKGHRYLIEACRILKERGVAFRCDFVGAGPLYAPLQSGIAASGLGTHVRLIGGQPRPTVARMLATADVAVLASHPTSEGKREGLPVALMEAMAAGLPVVASDLSGIPELVKHEQTGILVTPRDPVAIADALERLHRDRPLRDAMGRAGRRKVAAEFSLENNTRTLMQLFLRGPVAERPAAADTIRPARAAALQ